jgi:RNA-directed DNA polymerase
MKENFIKVEVKPIDSKFNIRWKSGLGKVFPRTQFGPKIPINPKYKFIIKANLRSPCNLQGLWEKIVWAEVREAVFEKQKIIYALQKKGDLVQMHKIQAELIKSPEAKFLATRRVTQDNRGNKTGGIDGISKLIPRDRYFLATKFLFLDKLKASPILRVWIPKPGSKEMRPLGIPTIIDRAMQALVKLALEPEWEAKFEPHSYGFRPGRRCHDATKVIRLNLIHARKFVYDADVKKCFDTINHVALLAKLTQKPNNPIYKAIKAWLKAGIVENDPFPPSNDKGTPQGGICSPLLANIALHGLEIAVNDAIQYSSIKDKRVLGKQTKVIRYADDFIILAPTYEILQISISAAKSFLKEMGLVIKDEKTRTLHTLDKKLCPDGSNKFKFLGFEFFQIPVGKYRAGKASGGRRVPWISIATPHPKRVQAHFDALRKIFKTSASARLLITRVNPVIRGWRNYFSKSDGSTFGIVAALNKRIFLLCSNWVRRNHHTRKRLSSVWTKVANNSWTFYAKAPTKENPNKVITMQNYNANWSLINYVGIVQSASPYDGNTAYWSKRSTPGNRTSKSDLVEKLFKKQKGNCPLCAAIITPLDIIEIDHKIPKSKGGTDAFINLQLLHKECHAKKTATERKAK